MYFRVCFKIRQITITLPPLQVLGYLDSNRECDYPVFIRRRIIKIKSVRCTGKDSINKFMHSMVSHRTADL